MSYMRVTEKERRLIYVLSQEGKGVREIVIMLECTTSTMRWGEAVNS